MNTTLFHHLTGHPPFPWQERLYLRWAEGLAAAPRTLTLPTGTGKTSVIAIWLMVLAERPAAVPRRLVYVVNRRTVVDQTTDEVLKLQSRLADALETPDRDPELFALANTLRQMCVIDLGDDSPLAVSTLRGQLADNRAWSADPCRPAVIVGTVDMIGSRLLFGGYRSGFKTRPLQAAFLAQDALLIHDEAHLEPAFQAAVEAIATEQRREHQRNPEADPRRLTVIALSATNRRNGGVSGDARPFELDAKDLADQTLRRRVEAKKRLTLHSIEDDKQLAERITRLALEHEPSGEPILIFVQKVDDVAKVQDTLLAGLKGQAKKEPKNQIALLTGTIRGHERDALVINPVFKRFLPGTAPDDPSLTTGTVYLICTSAGEVGVNLNAKHLVCDLTTFESMAQRFGRVNRFGDEAELPPEQQTRIDVVHCTKRPKAKTQRQEAYEAALAKTRELLARLTNASPQALGELDPAEREAAFSPEPKILPVTDILLDHWSLTSIREAMPGRPPLEPYLHGIDEDYDPPRTALAWREEVELLKGDLVDRYQPEALLEAFPLKPHELLSDTSDRVFKELDRAAKRLAKGDEPKAPENIFVWAQDEHQNVERTNLGWLLGDKERIQNRTLILPPFLGGLNEQGMLDGSVSAKDVKEPLDVSCVWQDRHKQPLREESRRRLRGADERPKGWRRVVKINFADPEDEEENLWEWFERKWGGDGENLNADPDGEVLLADHCREVEAFAEAFAKRLGFDDDLTRAFRLAGRWHDLGKARDQWQRGIGNPTPANRLAKSGPGMKALALGEYRHEFGSLLDLEDQPEFAALSEDHRDLVRHLIAAHHGRARPHFTAAEATDPERGLSLARTASAEVPHRFARLQQRYGRWGLAYLESLLRAADYAASAHRRLRSDAP